MIHTSPPIAANRHFRLVLPSRFSRRASRPHSGHTNPGTPPMSYQHLGHRRRPRARSRKSDHHKSHSPARASTPPPSHQIHAAWAMLEHTGATATRFFGSRIDVGAGEPFFAAEPVGLASLDSLPQEPAAASA